MATRSYPFHGPVCEAQVTIPVQGLLDGFGVVPAEGEIAGGIGRTFNKFLLALVFQCGPA